MRKKLLLGLLALVLSSGIAVFGSTRGLVDKIFDSVLEGFAATFTTDERRAWKWLQKPDIPNVLLEGGKRLRKRYLKACCGTSRSISRESWKLKPRS